MHMPASHAARALHLRQGDVDVDLPGQDGTFLTRQPAPRARRPNAPGPRSRTQALSRQRALRKRIAADVARSGSRARQGSPHPLWPSGLPRSGPRPSMSSRRAIRLAVTDKSRLSADSARFTAESRVYIPRRADPADRRRRRRTRSRTRPSWSRTWRARSSARSTGATAIPRCAAGAEASLRSKALEDAVVFSSGMAAVTRAILALVKQDAHVVLFADCYRRTRQFVTGFLAQFGVAHTLVPPGDLDALERAITDKTRARHQRDAHQSRISRVVDLTALCADRARSERQDADRLHVRDADQPAPGRARHRPGRAQRHQVPGRSQRRAGGCRRGQRRAGRRWCATLRHVFGAVLRSACGLPGASRGIKTLALRVAQQNKNGAGASPRCSRSTRKVKRVWYPGPRARIRSHAIAKRMMSGFGGVVTFELDGGPGDRPAVRRRAADPAHRAQPGRRREPGRAARADELLRAHHRGARGGRHQGHAWCATRWASRTRATCSRTSSKRSLRSDQSTRLVS